MDMLETLRRTGGLEAMSRQLDLTPPQSAAAAEALLPFMMGGFKRYCHRAGPGAEGVPALFEMLNKLGDGQMAISVMTPGSLSLTSGAAVLDAVFGSPEAIIAVASAAAERSELGTASLRRMLPLLAMLVGGYISVQVDGANPDEKGVAALLDLEVINNPLDEVLLP